MPLQLSDDDGRAVDLILDTPLRVKNGDYAGAGASHLQPNIEAASKLLSLLTTMPDEEMASDLPSRLIQRVKEMEQDVHLGNISSTDNLGTQLP